MHSLSLPFLPVKHGKEGEEGKGRMGWLAREGRTRRGGMGWKLGLAPPIYLFMGADIRIC
jgi:hypothetical protein